MNKIFISYSSADHQYASTLRQLFQSKGWAVWQDRTDIPPGVEFDDAIEQAIGSAQCVVVIWTENSARSQWVKSEAAVAAKRRTLVPVRFDNVSSPLRFHRLQTVDLRHWSGKETSPEIQKLLNRVEFLLGDTPQSKWKEGNFSEFWRRIRRLKFSAVTAGTAITIASYYSLRLLITLLEQEINLSSNMLVLAELACTMLGGWVSAHCAGFSEVMHGVSLGVILVILGVITSPIAPVPSVDVPWWLVLAYIPFATLGGWFNNRHEKYNKL